jgi:hypothetical protein
MLKGDVRTAQPAGPSLLTLCFGCMLSDLV